jgi:MFS family permease
MIPFFLGRFGIKKVIKTAMLAWAARFFLLAIGNPGEGVWLFIASMLIYGVAFDFFNIAGSLFVNKATKKEIRSSAQGLFMIMTNGIGASIGMLIAQAVVNNFTYSQEAGGQFYTVGEWPIVWGIFAAYALLVAIFFALIFKEKNQ